MKLNQTPRHKHDCSGCVYLGSDVETEADYYFCPSAKPMPDLIARYSSSGSDYSSMPVQLIDTLLTAVKGQGVSLAHMRSDHPLVRAFRAAAKSPNKLVLAHLNVSDFARDFLKSYPD